MSHVSRAVELAHEQRERFDKKKATLEPKPHRDLLTDFYSEPYEAEQAFLIMTYLSIAYNVGENYSY